MGEQRNIANLAGALVGHMHILGRLSAANMRWARRNPEAALNIFVDVVNNRKKTAEEEEKLLQHHSFFRTEAVSEFVAEEKFVEGKTIDGVSIGSLGKNFQEHLLKKVEKGVAMTKLRVHKLVVDAKDETTKGDPGIIQELGGRHESMLAHLHQLLAYKQRTEDFFRMIAYVCDGEGNPWTVYARWSFESEEWNMEAYLPDGLGKWTVGTEVVSV